MLNSIIEAKMPVYDYKCSTCGKTFEYKQRISEDALTTCPAEICEEAEKGKGEVKRVVSGNVGLVFKGSGFYLTDYKNGGSSPANGNGQANGTSDGKPESDGATKKAEAAKAE